MAQYPATTTSSKLLVTKSNAVGQSLTTVTFTVTNGGTSAWQQIIASTASDTLITGIGFYCATGGGSAVALPAEIDIAYGGGGSEVALDSVFLHGGNTSAAWFPGGWAALPIPQRVASGQRVAVRGKQLTSWGASFDFSVYMATVPYANTEGN